jgi:hypothetical protein
MPEFLTAVVSSIGASVGGTAGAFLVMNAGAVATGTLLVGGLAVTDAQRKKAKRQAREGFNSAQVDRLVNVQTSILSREMVLGRVRKGGGVFFRGSVGAFKEKYVMLIALAAHEIDGIEQIYFNNEPVTLDVDGYVQTEPYSLSRIESAYVAGSTAPPEAIPGTIYSGLDEAGNPVTHYQYSVGTPKARVRWYLGTDSQAAAPDVMADFPTLWTANHRARGVAYLHCEFWYDETAFPSGLPTVTALMRGAKIYDPRSATTAFTENPSLHQRHVLLHPQFGKRASLSAAEDARITAAANACDTSYNYGDGVVPMYRAGLVVPFGAAPRDVLDDLAQAMAGSWAYAAGEFYAKAGVYTAPVMSLGVQDLVRYIESSGGSREEVPMVVATHRGRNEKINVITPRIYDSAQDYKQAALAPLKISSYITRDGAELAQEVDMQAVGYAKQAHHIAGIMLRDARDPLTFTATFKLKTWPLELFDTISLTLPVYGWSAKTFEIRSRVYMPGQGVQLTLKETAAAITQPDASFPAQGFAANTSSPRPWDINPPAITAIASGNAELADIAGTVVPRVRVSWSAIADLSISQSGQVELEWQEVGKPSRQTVRVSGSLTQAFLDGVSQSRTILIRARTRNAVAVSDWSVQQEHFVVGKTAPPPAFDVFTVLAQPDGTRQYNFGYTSTAQPLDWLGAQIRYTPGAVGSPVWESMTPLQDGESYYTDSPVERNAPLAGEFTFACRSLDTSGNPSTALVRTITLGQRRTGRVFDEYNERTDSWPGTLGSMTELIDPVNGGSYLEATDSTTWDDLTTWDAWTRWNMSPASPCSYTSAVQDLGTVLAGQIDVPLLDADGSEVVEIRSSLDNITFTSWGSPASAFTARYVQIRITLTATGGEPVPALRQLGWQVSADLKREYLNDINIATLTGSYRIGTGDVRVPLANSYAVIKRLGVTIQDSGAGSWTWQRIDNVLTFGPRVQFRYNGTLTDPALVDFDIEGI